MERLIYLIVLLGLGKCSRYLKVFPDNTSQVLNQFALNISLPATILLKLNGLEINLRLLMLALIPWLLVGCSVLIVRWLGRVLSWDNKTIGAAMVCTGLGNTAFFGYPAISVFLGEQYLAYAVIYDQLGTFLALATFGTIVVSVYGTPASGKQQNLIIKILRFPPFSCMLLGFALMNVDYPDAMRIILEGISATLIPVTIFSVGSVLVFRQPNENIVPIGLILGLKMVVWPVIAFLVLRLLGVKGPVFVVSIFQAAMPTMVMAGVIAQAGHLKTDVANAAIGYGILLALVTLPLLSFIIA